MKRYIYGLFLICILFFSCKDKEQNNFNGEFDNVTLYYYGRSHMGTTYEIPLKFYANGKEIAFFVLYSLSPDLDNGTYIYNDSLYLSCQIFNDFAFTDKTFYKNVCKWNGNKIINGNVTVTKNNDNYTFLIDIIDINGENHKGVFRGKVKKEIYHQQSKINGIFANACIDKCDYGQFYYALPENYNGGITWIELQAGDWIKGMEVNIIFLHPEIDDFTGVYYVNSNSTIQSIYCKNIADINSMDIVSGTFTITSVSKPYKFKIDVDIIAKNGDAIKGSFDGGEIWFFGGYNYQNYADYNYADYYN